MEKHKTTNKKKKMTKQEFKILAAGYGVNVFYSGHTENIFCEIINTEKEVVNLVLSTYYVKTLPPDYAKGVGTPEDFKNILIVTQALFKKQKKKTWNVAEVGGKKWTNQLWELPPQHPKS